MAWCDIVVTVVDTRDVVLELGLDVVDEAIKGTRYSLELALVEEIPELEDGEIKGTRYSLELALIEEILELEDGAIKGKPTGSMLKLLIVDDDSGGRTPASSILLAAVPLPPEAPTPSAEPSVPSGAACSAGDALCTGSREPPAGCAPSYSP